MVLCVHTSARSQTAEGVEASAAGLDEERRADVQRVRDAPADWVDDTFGEAPVPV